MYSRQRCLSFLAREKKEERTPIENDRFYPLPPPVFITLVLQPLFLFSPKNKPVGACMYVCMYAHAPFAITDIYLLLLLVTIWGGCLGRRRCYCWVLGYSIRFDSMSLVLVLFFVCMHACMQCRPLLLMSHAFSLFLISHLLSLSLSLFSLYSTPQQQQQQQQPPPPGVKFHLSPLFALRFWPALVLPCFFWTQQKTMMMVRFWFVWLCADGLGMGGDLYRFMLRSALSRLLSSPPNIRARWRLRRIEITALFSVHSL